MASPLNAIGNVDVLKVGNLASCEITWRNILLRAPPSQVSATIAPPPPSSTVLDCDLHPELWVMPADLVDGTKTPELI